MNRPIPWRWLVLSIGLAAVAIGEESSMKRFDFEADKPGDAPQGFSFGRTGHGAAGKWVVQPVSDAPSGRNVLVQTDTDGTDYRFPIAYTGPEHKDLRLPVNCSPVSDLVDHASGLV